MVSEVDLRWMKAWHNTWYIQKNGYVAARFGKKHHNLHKIIADPPEGFETDHIDRNPRNNVRTNLRIVTRGQNMMNKSFYGKGYKINGKKWEVQVTRNGERLYKIVNTEEEARLAVLEFRGCKTEEIEISMPACLSENHFSGMLYNWFREELLCLDKELVMKSKELWKSRRLSDDDIKGLLYTFREGSVRQKDLAEVYGVTQAYVSRLVNGKTKRGVRTVLEHV